MTEPNETSGPPPKKRKKRRELVRKWGKPVIDAGFTSIPSLLIINQCELKLDPVDMCILLHLAQHWWKANELPFPRKKTMAERIGVDQRTVQRHLTGLEKRGYIKRITRTNHHLGRLANGYDLRPLADLLHPLAINAQKEKQEKQAKKAAYEAWSKVGGK